MMEDSGGGGAAAGLPFSADAAEEVARLGAARYVRAAAADVVQQLPNERLVYLNTTRRVVDPVEAERRRAVVSEWSFSEQKTFLRRYVQFPKDFGKVATFLPGRSVGDVIEFYYKHKLSFDLEKLLRVHKNKERRRLAASRTGAPSPSPSTPTRAEGGEGGEGDRSLNRSRGSEADLRALAALEAKWETAEQQLFGAALHVHGKDWSKIADYIGTKSPDECKKFYSVLRKAGRLSSLLEDAGALTGTRRARRARE
jgi:hypothetical protein